MITIINNETIEEFKQLGIDLNYNQRTQEFDLIIHNTKIFKECIEFMRPKWIKYLKSKGAEYHTLEFGTKNGYPVGYWIIKKDKFT